MIRMMTKKKKKKKVLFKKWLWQCFRCCYCCSNSYQCKNYYCLKGTKKAITKPEESQIIENVQEIVDPAVATLKHAPHTRT